MTKKTKRDWKKSGNIGGPQRDAPPLRHSPPPFAITFATSGGIYIWAPITLRNSLPVKAKKNRDDRVDAKNRTRKRDTIQREPTYVDGIVRIADVATKHHASAHVSFIWPAILVQKTGNR